MALFLVLLAVLGPSPAAALEPRPEFYVNDYVGILSADDIALLTGRGSGLYRENGVQVVAVIVPNYIGESMAAYANRIFNDFGIGSSGVNNGILLLFAVDDAEVRIEVGDGLSAQLPDSEAGAILDERFLPAANAGDYAGAVYQTYLALIREGSRLDTAGPPGGVAGWLKRLPLTALAAAALVVLLLVTPAGRGILLTVLQIALRSGGLSGGSRGAGRSGGGGGRSSGGGSGRRA